ncbi:hypothetical protein K505DRAFT_327979 [Melanomma pulvis-pyrius CBS 109.77]|uniref:Uncharacterized protein n=1 Tax=Melanomma pulvis-pyrius CBS 109.77 TaxID=1314802 RepID=A0A6A6X0F2_9PLEO|nr:hypothetical protein K505DRAFT_327979 [Melanomma pulvis-pyrius CBS 109.77]
MVHSTRLLDNLESGGTGDGFKPIRYDLKIIGPPPQESKVLKRMSATVGFMKGRGTSECPFAGMRSVMK